MKELEREILLAFWKVHILHHAGEEPLHGPFLRTLGASAAAISIIAGVGEPLGYSLRSIAVVGSENLIAISARVDSSIKVVFRDLFRRVLVFSRCRSNIQELLG